MEKHWTNYGDVNWKEHGGIFMREDEDNEGEYVYVEVQPTTGEEPTFYVLSELHVSLEDIAHPKDVASFGGFESLDEALEDAERFILDAVQYWGVEGLGGTQTVCTLWWEVLTELSAWRICEDVRVLDVSPIEGRILTYIAENTTTSAYSKGTEDGVFTKDIIDDLGIYVMGALDCFINLSDKGHVKLAVTDEGTFVTLKGKARELTNLNL
ncbi:hypothetical protein [Bacillus phage SDFMU_Pbc]|uniref:Uncharacterized protein n=1 Tax=Bacillus phage SDFMU_Pbc TaxID=3076135 RepID=A0AA96KRR9_9CAUD|nr:hypothetical protein [Bacillus phage SDFMU_Pbc]